MRRGPTAYDLETRMIRWISDSTFTREVLLSKEPVLVAFIADRCEPCRAMLPTLEQFASEMNGRASVAPLNVDKNPAMRALYRIHGLPTLIIFLKGEIIARRVGAVMQKDDLMTWLEASVGDSQK